MRAAGLFAGIGGFESGLHRSGHEANLLCDVLPAARAVLTAHFPGVDYRDDITKLRDLPASTDLICAGFPCQDLSQAGRTAGLDGERSGLIGEVFRLLSRRRVPTVVVENVPFMLQLNGGSAMRAITDEFERRGYRWAYRAQIPLASDPRRFWSSSRITNEHSHFPRRPLAVFSAARGVPDYASNRGSSKQSNSI